MLVMHSQTLRLLRQSNSPVVDATSVFGVLFCRVSIFSQYYKGNNIEWKKNDDYITIWIVIYYTGVTYEYAIKKKINMTKYDDKH